MQGARLICLSPALMLADKPGVAAVGPRRNRHVSGSLRRGAGEEGESCTFLLDEALTKQKVMTCEVVLTAAAGRLPDRAARQRSRGPLRRAPQS